MVFRAALLFSLFLCATSFVYSQKNSSTRKRAIQVLQTKCNFSDREPLRLWNSHPNTVEKKVDPIYPQEALDAKIEGKVLLTVLVDKAGNVVETCVEDGHALLVPAAIDAAKQWKFKKNFGFAANRYSKRQYFQTSISIVFRIQKGD